MKEIIGRLAKGITDIETPEITASPESFSCTVNPGADCSNIIELTSVNGYSVKGICFSDVPEVSIDNPLFTGRRVHVTFRLDTRGLLPGDKVDGSVDFVTNAGEFSVPFDFFMGKQDGDGGRIELDTGNAADLGNALSDECITDTADGTYTETDVPVIDDAGESPDQTDGELAFLSEHIPEDEPLFEAILTALIRQEESSPLAFAYYKEAIIRGLDVTRLYESYVGAYPDDCTDPMPKEVLLYFSYEHEPGEDICIRLYNDILNHVEADSDLFSAYEQRMGSFAMREAMRGRIDERLANIYRRMIYPEAIDRRAAMTLPDLFKCHMLGIAAGQAAYASVSYSELKGRHVSRINGGRAYLPVYFDDAKIEFFDDQECTINVTGTVRYTDRELFRAPELIRRCFELYPEHAMLLLSAAREIVSRGAADESEKNVLTRALNELPLSDGFRASLITALCLAGGSMDWFGNLRQDDYRLAGSDVLFDALVDAGMYTDAYGLLLSCGRRHLNEGSVAGLVEAIVSGGMVPSGDDGAADPYFVRLCRAVTGTYADAGADTGANNDDNKDFYADADTDAADIDNIDVYVDVDVDVNVNAHAHGCTQLSVAMREFLLSEYEASSEDMYSVLAAIPGFDAGKDLSASSSGGTGLIGSYTEKILGFKLFSGNRTHIDEVFKLYSGCGEHNDSSDLLIRAYFTVRCADYFFNESKVDEGILFKTLEGYMLSTGHPEALPVVWLLAITKHYSGMDSLNRNRQELCGRLIDYLIEKGLVFRYTKLLRKKVSIPDDICRRFYIEYHAAEPDRDGETPQLSPVHRVDYTWSRVPEQTPRLITRLAAQEENYRSAELSRVYGNIYLYSAVLFKGDELQYMIYASQTDLKPAEEGVISVHKYHRHSDVMFEELSTMMKALERRDTGSLKESMLAYAEHDGLVKELFDLEK